MMQAGTMNSRERILAAALHKPTDILPVALYNGNYAIKAAGFKLGECYTNGRKLAAAQLRTWERLPQDVIVVQSDGYYIAEAMGSQVAYHEDSLPTMIKPRIVELMDVHSLKKPDPWKDGRIPVYLEAIQEVRKQVGDSVAIRGCGAGPFVLACHLLGTERFMLELAQAHYGLADTGHLIIELLDICCDALIDFVDAQLDLGVTIVQCADSSASIDLISPEIYVKYAFPNEQRFFETIRQKCHQNNAVSLLHICGDNTKVFELHARTGADIIEVDHKADLKVAKDLMGSSACLIGNLDPAGHLLLGTVNDVEHASIECISKAAGGGAFILGSGCEIAMNTPPENLEAAVRMARQFSYDAADNSIGSQHQV